MLTIKQAKCISRWHNAVEVILVDMEAEGMDTADKISFFKGIATGIPRKEPKHKVLAERQIAEAERHAAPMN